MTTKCKSKTRYHFHKTVLKSKMPTVKSHANRLSNEKARAEFYHKFETKSDAHVARINFFKPKWDEVKHQVFVFSSSSSSTSDNSGHINVSHENSTLGAHSIIKSPWALAISAEEFDNSNAVLWAAAAADPSDCENCDRSADINEDKVKIYGQQRQTRHSMKT